MAEEAAYMHITKPTLIVPHSSDILRTARLARMVDQQRKGRK